MTLFLDLDGTILDPRPRYAAIHAAALAPHPATLDMAKYWEQKRDQVPEETIVQEQYPDIDIADYLRKRAALLEDPSMLEQDVPFPGAVAALKTLKSDHPLVLVTLRNKPQHLDAELKRLDLTSFFEAILTAPGGQEPWEVKASLIRSVARPEDWIVGDTEADVRGGQRAGIRTCAVSSGIRTEAFLRSLGPDVLLPSIGDLPQFLGK